MPRRAKPLTAVEVKNAGQGVHVDGNGLMLVIKGDAASWMLRYSFKGKRRDMGLGPARGSAALSLAEARGQAVQARAIIQRGTDPLEARRQEKEAAKAAEEAKGAADTNTFKAMAEAYHRTTSPAWKNIRHRQQWLREMELYVFPLIGKRPVAGIEAKDIQEVLAPIWAKLPETASRLRGRLENVLSYASASGLRPPGLNPATWRGNLAFVFGRPDAMKAAKRRALGKGDNHPSLHWQQLPAFMAELAKDQGLAAPALRFLILTGARAGEVTGLTWREIDMASGVWTVPAARMKANATHFVPLSQAALSVLASVRPADPKSGDHVFPGRWEGAALRERTLGVLLHRMSWEGRAEGDLPIWRDAEDRAVVPHGFRATFKGWSLAKGWPDHLSEKALAHSDPNAVRRAYARDALIEERRPMMEAWAALCTGQGAAVASLDEARARKASA